MDRAHRSMDESACPKSSVKLRAAIALGEAAL